MANDTIKLAGPDAANNYKVLQTKGTLKVRPNDLLTQRYVEDHLLSRAFKMKCDTTIIAPRFGDGEKPLNGGLGTFKGTVTG